MNIFANTMNPAVTFIDAGNKKNVDEISCERTGDKNILRMKKFF